jgi:hypothetical protein
VRVATPNGIDGIDIESWLDQYRGEIANVASFSVSLSAFERIENSAGIFFSLYILARPSRRFF